MNRLQNFGPPYISGTSSSFRLIFSNSQSRPSFSPSLSQASLHSSMRACLYLSAFASLIASSSVPRTLRRVRPARPSGRHGRARSAGAPCAPLRAGAPVRRGGGAREPARGTRAAHAARRRHLRIVQDCGKACARRTAGASRGFQRLSRSSRGPYRCSARTHGGSGLLLTAACQDSISLMT